MRIYATRRECEIILSCIYDRMSTLKIDEMSEYNDIASRILGVTAKQCKGDNSHYKEDEK